MYLGDGYVVHHRRGVYRLTITLDAKYPGIVSECRKAIEAVMPMGKVGIQFRFGGTCAWVVNSSKQWPCLLPQHGAGRNTSASFGLRIGSKDSSTATPGTSYAG